MTISEDKGISEKLLQLIEPYMQAVDRSRTKQRLSSLLLVGSTAWNIEVTGDTELKGVLLQSIEDNEGLPEVEDVIDNLAQRKKELFPDDDRLILDCKILSAKRNKYDVTVSFLYRHEYENSLK